MVPCAPFWNVRLLFAALLLNGILLPASSYAQQIPGAADPARVVPEFVPGSRNLEKLQEKTPEKKIVPQIPAGMESLTFILHDLEVEGMTAYSEKEILPLYSRYIEKEISVATLFEIMAALQQKYFDDGYTLTRVVLPNQNINEGQAVFSVTEGYVSEVELSQGILPNSTIDDAVRRIESMRPLNTLTLERILLILNDLPDLDVSAVLASIKDKEALAAHPGAVRMILEKNESLDSRGSVSFDNYGSVFSGPGSVHLNGRIFNIGKKYSTLEAGLSGSIPFSEQRVASLSYTIPALGASGTNLNISGVRAWTQPGASLRDLDIRGNSENISLNISYPAIKQRASTCDIDAGFEYKNSSTKILGEDFYDDRLRVVTAGINYAFSDTMRGFNVMDAHVSKGLDALSASQTGQENLSRQDGHPDFHKFNLYVGRIQSLPKGFEIFSLASGQYASDPLLSAEEFGFGGAQAGRGYDPSEITGDHGISATFELRYRKDTTLANLPMMVQPYAFFDIGKIWNIDDNDTIGLSAASTGLGVRLNVANQWDSTIMFAIPLTKSPDNPPKYANESSPRLLLSVSRRF